MDFANYSNNSSSSFYHPKGKGLGHPKSDGSTQQQGKTQADKKPSNALKVTLEQVRHFCKEHGYKLSAAYSSTFKKASDYKVKAQVQNSEILSKKADEALENLMSFRSPSRVLAGMEKNRVDV